MKFQTTAGRVVNRDGKTYTADKNGVIEADSTEIALIFTAYGFKSLETNQESNENKESPKRKRNPKV